MGMLVSSDELKHHGIKGQKWGVRRFQNKDGSLTAAGRKRYDDSDGKMSRADKISAKYQKKGLSKENADQLAARKIKAQKIVAAAAAVTVAAATAYVVSRKLNYEVDKVIKTGSKFQRISANNDINRSLYVSYKNKDNMKYVGLLGKTKGVDAGLNKIKLKTTSNIKISSRKNAEDTFIDLYKNNKHFKMLTDASMKQMINEGWYPHGMNGNVRFFLEKKGQVSDRELRKEVYDAFNFGLANTRGNAGSAAKIFYDALREKGYDAITDMNDKKYSGYNTKAPTIVFNSTKLAIDSIEKLSSKEITDSYVKSMQQLGQEKALKSTLKILGTASASIAGISGVSLSQVNKSVIKYRKKHPDTQLSDKEIIDMLYKRG